MSSPGLKDCFLWELKIPGSYNQQIGRASCRERVGMTEARRRHTRWPRDWSSDVCSSDLTPFPFVVIQLDGMKRVTGMLLQPFQESFMGTVIKRFNCKYVQ